ncbi:Panacea domain-containing protein [Helicobacter rodentium]|uniref:Panacea domain-containing protein n=1 Tax=Helicobacter rodentium TaxID=59617 RepID=UPI000690DA5D|nr:type II toxin-antitoxin system antitoxin SocA domain-containing protein [Helicobacter rodentium]
MKALEVAKHIINYCIGINKPVSNLQLQKMLYFLDIFYLVNKKGRLITDKDFQAWQYGPVIPEVYQNYAFNAAYPINIRQDIKEEFPDDYSGYLYAFIHKLAKMKPWDLVDLSHEPNQPWSKAYIEGKKETISTELMEEYAKQQR